MRIESVEDVKYLQENWERLIPLNVTTLQIEEVNATFESWLARMDDKIVAQVSWAGNRVVEAKLDFVDRY